MAQAATAKAAPKTAPKAAPTKKKREVVAPAKQSRFSARVVDTVVNGVHVAPRGASSWAVVKTGHAPLRKLFRDRERAVSCAREWARRHGAEVIVHRRDGSVEKLAAPSPTS